MKELRTYRDLDVWKRAKALSIKVYSITAQFPKEEMYGLTTQLRRAAVSVPSNIAEGCGRGTFKGTINFLFNARGSLYEIETQFLIAFELKYVSEECLRDVLDDVENCKRLLNGFIRYLEAQVTSN